MGLCGSKKSVEIEGGPEAAPAAAPAPEAVEAAKVAVLQSNISKTASSRMETAEAALVAKDVARLSLTNNFPKKWQHSFCYRQLKYVRTVLQYKI